MFLLLVVGLNIACRIAVCMFYDFGFDFVLLIMLVLRWWIRNDMPFFVGLQLTYVVAS